MKRKWRNTTTRTKPGNGGGADRRSGPGDRMHV